MTLQFTIWVVALVTVAVNCCVALSFTVADAGETAIVVSVWFTVTVTLLVTLSPPWSVMVAVKV